LGAQRLAAAVASVSPETPSAVRTATEAARPIVTAAPVAEAETEAASAEEETLAPSWPDDATESEFRAEARERGEPVRVAREPEEAEDEKENGALPKLEDLVTRIPAAVRETLEDLFRARFVAVKRVPRKALKP